MYELRSESIKTFVSDSTITLPRFQRKLTWNQKKNFRLALSLFRGYPLGVVVIKREETQDGALKKFLLDGRQRLNGLRRMSDPEEIYSWAKRALPLKNTDSPERIYELFRDYLDEYFGSESYPTLDDDAAMDDLSPEEVDETADTGFSVAEESASMELPVPEPAMADPLLPGLDDLLEVILMVHPKRRMGSGFTRLFDFMKYVTGLEYAETESVSGRPIVSAPRLKLWIDTRRSIDHLEGGPFPPEQEGFLRWLNDRTTIADDAVEPLRGLVAFRWPEIRSALMLLDRLDKRMQESQIGYLELKESSADDDKKIFEIINTAGTPLTAAEILSAKPDWNVEIVNPSPTVVESTAALYRTIGIPQGPGVVRWDYGATLLSRLNMGFVLGDSSGISETSFNRQVTLGFQLLSGFYAGRIGKNDIADLPRTAAVPWGASKLEDSLNDMVAALTLPGTDHFRFWRSWNLPLIDAMSDAVGLDFVLVLARDWQRKGSPRTSGSAGFKQFYRNAVTLFDRLVFEYVTGRWSGSSDSRIARNLLHESDDPVFTPILFDDWERLVSDVVHGGVIEGKSCIDRLDARVKLLLHYYYTLTHKMGPGGAVTIHVDHIIPQAFFETAIDGPVRANRHRIANLALLPQDVNLHKSDKTLGSVAEGFTGQELAKFTDIPQAEFSSYGTAASSQQLCEIRGAKIEQSLTVKRQSMIEEPFSYQP